MLPATLDARSSLADVSSPYETDPADASVLDDIEDLWGGVDSLFLDPAKVESPLPGSDFASDQQSYAGAFTAGIAGGLINSSIDHVRALRLLAGTPDNGGFGIWPSHAPWTMLRSSLEIASQAIWLCLPESQTERIERLLRFCWQDRTEWTENQLQNIRPRDRQKYRPLLETWQKHLIDSAGERINPDNLNKIQTRVSAVESVEDAAASSKIFYPNQMHSFWRITSSYAHGRLWAEPYATVPRPNGRAMDFKLIASVLIVVIETNRYAIWLLEKRNGHQRTEFSQVASVTGRQYASKPRPS